MSPAHLHQYAASLASPGQLSESLPASQVSITMILIAIQIEFYKKIIFIYMLFFCIL